MSRAADPVPGPVRAIFRGLAEDHPGPLLEDKIYTLALHYRLAPEAKRALEAAMENTNPVRGGKSRTSSMARR